MNPCVLRQATSAVKPADSDSISVPQAPASPPRIATPAVPGGLGGKAIEQILQDNCPQLWPAQGVVIESLDAHAGTWQFSLDQGQTWRLIRTDLINRPGSLGLALDAGARLRVLPFGGQRVQGARLVLHAVVRAHGANNGSYRPYAIEDREDGTASVALVLSLAAINGRPPAVRAPRPRNKRALLQRVAANQPQSDLDGRAVA